MPVAHLLQQMNATVTVCHSRTKNPQQFIKQADIIVAAIGKAEYVRGDWLKPGCVVIDVGINSVQMLRKNVEHVYVVMSIGKKSKALHHMRHQFQVGVAQ